MPLSRGPWRAKEIIGQGWGRCYGRLCSRGEFRTLTRSPLTLEAQPLARNFGQRLPTPSGSPLEPSTPAVHDPKSLTGPFERRRRAFTTHYTDYNEHLLGARYPAPPPLGAGDPLINLPELKEEEEPKLDPFHSFT